MERTGKEDEGCEADGAAPTSAREVVRASSLSWRMRCARADHETLPTR